MYYAAFKSWVLASGWAPCWRLCWVGSASACPWHCKICFPMNSHHKPHFTDTQIEAQRCFRTDPTSHLQGHVTLEWTGHTWSHKHTHSCPESWCDLRSTDGSFRVKQRSRQNGVDSWKRWVESRIFKIWRDSLGQGWGWEWGLWGTIAEKEFRSKTHT